MMKSRFLALALALPFASAVLTTDASDVYKWKDAKGVTHYGDRPPAGAKATRTAVRKPPAAVANTVVPTEHPQCVTARNNLALLKGSAPVGVDTNQDGKPDATMDAAERARQANLAQAGMDAYCKPVAAAPKA